MIQAIVTAIIAGICTIVSAVLTALIGKYGLTFWRSRTVIHCKGTAEELCAIQPDGQFSRDHRGYAYDVRNAYLTIKNERVGLSGFLTTTDGEITISDGQVRGSGVLKNGIAFVVYSVSDEDRHQAWSGLLMLRIPGLGELTGYWITEDHVAAGVVAVGSIVLSRS